MNKYAQLETDLRAFVKKGGRNLYDALSRARQMFDDPDFHAFRNLKSIDEVEDYLQKELDAIAGNLTVSELLAAFAVFPKRDDWGTKSLREMVDAATASVERDKPVVSRHRITRKDLEEAQQDAATSKRIAGMAQSQIKELESELAQLREENRELHSENANLKGRLAELERLMDRHMAVA